MIKARDLIKKEQKDVYAIEAGNSLQPRLEFMELKEVCNALAGKYYGAPIGARISERTRLNTKRYLLAKRLEREFLRGERKEKEKENKPLNGNNFTTIVMTDYSNEQLKKAAAENLESLVNGLFEDYTWLRGDITLSHFEAIRKSFSDQFSGFGEETFLEHFNQGEGDYFFKTTFHCTEELETWYEFELIDFKPLEVESDN